MIDPGIVLGGMKLLGGLFGKKPKAPSPRDNLLSQARGAREAAEKYGFNPLTMLQYGQAGGAMGGGGSPALASLDLMLDGAADIADVVSGDAARRRAAEDLNMDLAQLKLDQARSGVYVGAPPGAVRQGEFSPTKFDVGQPTEERWGQVAGPDGPMPFSLKGSPSWLAGTRPTEAQPVTNSPGYIEIDNALTGGSIEVPGDGGEPWGLDEVLTAVVVGAPQVVFNWGDRLAEKIPKEAKEYLANGPAPANWKPMSPEEKRAQEAADPRNKNRPPQKEIDAGYWYFNGTKWVRK